MEAPSWARRLAESPAYLRGIETGNRATYALAAGPSPAYLRGIETVFPEATVTCCHSVSSLPKRN